MITYDDINRLCQNQTTEEPCSYLKCMNDHSQSWSNREEMRADYFQCLYINELAKDLAEDLRCK